MVKENSVFVKKCFDEVRRKNPKNYITNSYIPIEGDGLLFSENDNSVVCIKPDKDIYRLYYGVQSFSDFDSLLSDIPEDLPVSVEIISKLPQNPILKDILNKYFIYDTTFIRSVCKLDNLHYISMQPDKNIIDADISDIPEIERLLNETFFYHSSHLPNSEELEYLIKEKQVIIFKKDEISGVLVFKRKNKVINFDQLINRMGNAETALMMMSVFYNRIKNLGAENCFIWVDIENNKKVQKMHEVFGYKPDGLKNIIYINKLLKDKIKK